jgi:subtilisin family serine protease
VRKLFWAQIKIQVSEDKFMQMVLPNLSEKSIGNLKHKFKNSKVLKVISAITLDAALLLGLPAMGDGEWSINTLNVSAAQKLATGKSVTVAILDHSFDKEHSALKGRIVNPGSVIEGGQVFTEVGSHGTWMANDLVKVAPDVRIMPVMIYGRTELSPADLYIKGIRYAVENGADIISLSHRAISKDRQADLDEAIEQASQSGVTFVYIHYRGGRDDVIVSGPIEFVRFDRGQQKVYVVGTNFISESSFPYTWGVSQSAPLVSGVIAMMKELNPGLNPREIREILLDSGKLTPDGYPLLDALAAVTKAKASLEN